MSRRESANFSEVRGRVWSALDVWPEPSARRTLLALCAIPEIDHQRAVGRALGRCGRHRREASEDFQRTYAADRRRGVRAVVLYARTYASRDNPRDFARELHRVASLPGTKPWPALMDAANLMWSYRPRDMFRLMTPWLTHRDPARRCTALHGIELPARDEPRSALKVLRLFRGERHIRVRRLLGHVFGQSLYPWHPEEALDEMTRWLEEGAASAPAVSRYAEQQIEAWFDAGRGSKRQLRRLTRAAQVYLDDEDSDVRAHARRLLRVLDEAAETV